MRGPRGGPPAPPARPQGILATGGPVPPLETWEEAKARNWQVILILLAMSMVQVVKEKPEVKEEPETREEPKVQVVKEEQETVVQVNLAYHLVHLSSPPTQGTSSRPAMFPARDLRLTTPAPPQVCQTFK